jgi:hypothetical protein
VRHKALVSEACRVWGHDRLTLPELDVEEAFPGFERAEVTVAALPRHHWASPLTDQIALVKLAVVTQPRRVLEIGSFQGHAALHLAMNLPHAEITTVDILENHGDVYRSTPFAQQITRHVGSAETLPTGPPFDFIFIDADHRQDEVRRDTRTALGRLAPEGVLVWHDYRDSFWTSKINRVPEVLVEYAHDLPIRSLRGTTLAVYRSSLVG